MNSDEIKAAELRGETIYNIIKRDNGDVYARAYPDFQTCNICHQRQPIEDLKCICSPPTYWCKRCTLEREAREFPNSKLRITV